MFQSAMRATAKLHLLSPAVFPLPFGAKIPLLKAPATAVSKKITEAASQAAATTAVEVPPSTEGISSCAGAEQAQQMLSISNLGATNSPEASAQVRQSMDESAAKHAQQVTPEGQIHDKADLTAMSSKQVRESLRAVLHKAGSKASNPVLPTVADVAAQRLQALIVGPVTKVVSSNKGLCVADRDTTGLRTSSLGTCYLLSDTYSLQQPHQLASCNQSLPLHACIAVNGLCVSNNQSPADRLELQRFLLCLLWPLYVPVSLLLSVMATNLH